MKAVVVGDMHLTDEKPASRTDEDFFAGQLACLDAIRAVAQAEKADAVLYLGDMLDGRRVSNRVQLGLGEHLAALKKSGVAAFTTLGQHDVRGHDASRYVRDSDLAVYETLGHLTVLRAGQYVEHKGVAVYGFAFGDVETKAFLEGRFVYGDECAVRVALVHATVGPRGMAYVSPIDEQCIEGVDWAFFGDVHCGFDLHEFPERGGRTAFALGPGAMTNMSVSEKDHEPCVFVVDFDDFSIAPYELPHAPASVFSGAEAAVADAASSEDFRQRLVAARERSSESDRDVVARVGREMGFEKGEIDALLGAMREDE